MHAKKICVGKGTARFRKMARLGTSVRARRDGGKLVLKKPTT